MATDTIRHRGRRGATLGAVLLAAALLGCSDDGPRTVAGDDDPPATTAAAETTRPSPGATEPDAKAEDEEPAADGAFLTEDDLPEGWVAAGTGGEEPYDVLGDPDEPTDEPADEDCPETPPPADIVTVGKVRFEDGPSHVLVQAVLAAPDIARAEELFSGLRASNGCTPEGPIEAVTVPGAGDQAYMATSPIGLLAGVRRGRSVAVVFTFSFDGTDDTDLVTGLLEVAADRLPA
ncbi:MAG TPA: hypothetical protein VGO60_10260 [Iamia sp.]|nr:hypothetical protein [Iamia sp.]